MEGRGEGRMISQSRQICGVYIATSVSLPRSSLSFNVTKIKIERGFLTPSENYRICMCPKA